MDHLRPAQESPRNLIRRVAELIGLAMYCRSRSAENGQPPHQRNTSGLFQLLVHLNRSVLAKLASVIHLGNCRWRSKTGPKWRRSGLFGLELSLLAEEFD